MLAVVFSLFGFTRLDLTRLDFARLWARLCARLWFKCSECVEIGDVESGWVEVECAGDRLTLGAGPS